MRSKFSYSSYLVAIGAFLLPLILVMSLLKNGLKSDTPIGLFVIICLFFLFIWIWMFFGELRTKIIKIERENENVIVRRYLGIGNSKHYNLLDISGFKTSVLSSKGGSYEYLYLMMDNKKVAKLSAFYHSNYKELKSHVVTMGIKNIGFEQFSNVQELKDIFN
ncbi:hypothetical protein [Mucilaginibacter sp. SP1R1]|uniref:hypothetical protein n=1 Tax=Mucilaginibacter sp. SP1R1 TaxID=2723091 RepID=UPI00160B4A5F|nr:hypothetical protein [Mucilaginibacter sp. SP1R1]MBB6151904.1 hypothetical protein [Mucilaginibacter sp. SP1R1]